MMNLGLFPIIEPYEEGWLEVEPCHKIYWQQSGNPQGKPIVLLHGGPGSGINQDGRCYFDPEFYRIIAFDQRGAGRSLPSGELKNNTTQHLVEDMEKLRAFFQIEKWLITGGSWGSTLALYYAQTYPNRCQGLLLRSIFLGRDFEFKWLSHDVRAVYPDAWDKFVNFIPEEKRGDIIRAYHELLLDPDPKIHTVAADHCLAYYGKIYRLFPQIQAHTPHIKDLYSELCLSRIQSHYYVNRLFMGDYNLLDNMDKISHLPGYIIHGRYDMCCPLLGAFDLSRAWKKAKLIVVPDAAHSNREGSFPEAIVEASNELKRRTEDGEQRKEGKV